MNRRAYLCTIGLGLSGSTAGCTGDDESNVQDSDGDGVIDSDDYAPRDPEVSRKSDLSTPEATPSVTEPATETRSITATSIESSTSTPTATSTPTPTPEPTVGANAIDANYEPIEALAGAYFRSYSLQGAKITFRKEGLDSEKVEDEMHVAVGAQEYPAGDLLDVRSTNAINIGSGETETTVEYHLEDISRGQSNFYLSAFLHPEGTSFRDAAEAGNVIFLCETDRLSLQGNRLEKDPHPDAKSTLESGDYHRVSGEGLYAIDVSGEVDFGMTVYKHAYIEANERPFREAKQVVRDSYENGLSSSFASIVHESAENAGYTHDREKANYAIRAIQAFPYVSDTVSSDYDDYNKDPVETVVEAGGDCEDSVILLASAFISSPFSYGCALLYIPPDTPDHVALGVQGSDDVEGSYYEYDDTNYYYTETTGEGWEVGEMPDQYRNSRANVVPIY